MALQVWLPLNGNLKNNGLFPTKPINYGATVNNFGKIGSCYLFDGVDDYLDSGYGESVSNQNLTITMWIKPITIGNSKIIFGADNGNNQRLYVGIYNGVYSLGFGKQPWKGTASIGPVINRWDFIAVVVNKNTASLYCNGQFVESITDSVFSFVSNFFIGGRSDGLNSNILANDFRIYDEVLSVKQIKEINKCLLAHYSLEGPGGNENFILASHKITSGSQAAGITRTYESDGSMKITATADNGNYCSIGFAKDSKENVGAKLKTGDTYSVSCDIKIENGTSFPDLFINGTNGYKTLKGDITKKGEWQRASYTNTWNTPEGQYGNISLHLGFSGREGTYYFKNFKLEKGNPTVWTPAPTDAQYVSLGYGNNWSQDLSGNGYNANIVGTLTFNEDSPRYSGSTKFYGNGYLNNIPSPIHSSTDSFTFACWYYPTEHTTGALYNNRTSVGNGVAVFHINEKLRFDTSNLSQFITGPSVTLNKWQHIVCIYSASQKIKRIYINGELIGETSEIGNLNTVGTIASIGASSANDTGGGNTVSGSISDVRLYGTALSEEDIKALYNQGGYIDNEGNWGSYNLTETLPNKLFAINDNLNKKKMTGGLSYYTQTNCQVTLTDQGYRIYRPPNLIHNNDTMHNMWGGFRINPMSGNTSFLQKGHTYILLFDAKGQTNNIPVITWSNNMGWGGGGLNPQPSNVSYKNIPKNWQSDEYETFFYKWTIEDDIYKVCTSAYANFIEGETYLSYKDFYVGFGYENTGALGTDIYIRNLRCYDITNLKNINIESNGTIMTAALQETNFSPRIHYSGEISGNKYIEI